MKNNRLILVVLQVLLGCALLLLAVFAAMSLPGSLQHLAAESGEIARLRWPLLFVGEVATICLAMVVIATWILLRRVAHDEVFSQSSLRWVNVILYSLGAAWLIVTILLGAATIRDGEPGNAMAALLIVVPGAVLILLLVVMRSLLIQATDLRTDLEGVI